LRQTRRRPSASAGYPQPSERSTAPLAERLLKRNAYGIAWTKRVLNQRLRAAYNISFDAGIGYEFLTNYMQSEQAQARAEGRVNRL
jgi:hypothetical protein